MLTFPTLSIPPSVELWGEGESDDPTIKSPAEAGLIKTRARFTRIPRMWRIGYKLLPETEKNFIRSFEDAVKVGSDAFYWKIDHGFPSLVKCMSRMSRISFLEGYSFFETRYMHFAVNA